MRIMTFNIQHGQIWEKQAIDLEPFADFIKDKSPDICGLNEVRGRGETDPEYTNQTVVLGALADYNNYFGESVKIHGTDPYGNALLSKNAFKSAETVKIPDVEDGKWHETRSVIKAVIEVQGRDVCVLVSHFGLDDEEKINAVKTVCDIIDATDMPLILMGDFNMTPEDKKLIPIRERLADSDDAAGERGVFTYASFEPNRKIDYVFYKDLVCISCHTVGEMISDHFPIVCEFEFVTK